MNEGHPMIGNTKQTVAANVAGILGTGGVKVTAWQECKLGDLLDIKHGYAFLGEYFANQGSHIVLTPGNFYDEGGFKHKGDKEKWYSGPVPDDYILSEGDLIVAMTEQAEGLLGSSAIIPRGGLYLHNQRLGLVQVRDDRKADKHFLYYLFNSKPVRQQIRGSASGTKIRDTAPSRIADVKVCIPPLPVQQRIAGILSAYDELIENGQRRIKILEAMARALYREWFVHFRFPGHESVPRVASTLGDIPQGWEVKCLCDLFDFIGGSQPPKSEHIHEERPGYVRFIQNRDYGSSSHLTYIAESRRNKICGRLDIMVDKYGEPGKTRFGLAGAYNVALAKLLPHEPNHREWLRGLISEPDFNTYLAGASMAATRASLNSSHFTVDVAIPPIHIAKTFHGHIEPLLKLILTHQDAIANLRRTRDLLLPRLLSGQIDVEAA